MNWFKDIIRAISKRKHIYFFLFLQLWVSIYNSYTAVNGWRGTRCMNNEITNFVGLDDIYCVTVNFSENVPTLKVLDFNIGNELEAKSKYKIASFKHLQSKDRNVDYVLINSNFLHIFKFDVIKGKSNFQKGKNQALAGYDYITKYKVGDIINKDGKDIEIIGFLKKDHGIFESGVDNLDNSIVVLDDNIKGGTNTCYVISKNSYSKTKNDIAKILSNQGTVDFTDLKESLSDSKAMEYERAKNITVYSIGMVLFSISVFIALIILIINKNKRDIGIKIACGGKKFSVYGYMIGQVIFTYVIAALFGFMSIWITCLKWRQKLFKMFSLDYVIIMNLSILLLIVIVSIPIFIKIMKLDPAELVKGE